MAKSAENHLINETSPYLLQHANNPVEWYPWCDEALQHAKREDKPILLSIGYSACHWCHVMAHESFEDNDIAQVMNELYVNVKVDREERPDVDKIYQLSHQLLTQRAGGWPLNMFLTPDEHIPYFGGTYFPKSAGHNMPAFADILRQAADFYHQQKDGLKKHNQAFNEAIRSMAEPHPKTNPDEQSLHKARQAIGNDFDSQHGGFGEAPKFPHATLIEYLLRYWSMTGQTDLSARNMAETSLLKMANGGIFDQIGGGFCRYSVDDFWLIPHFEKMLYDNGPLLALYAQAFQISGNPVYKNTALAIADWVTREMQSADGGYYSSLDADSEGQEGKYYVWDRAEIEQLLSDDEYQMVGRHYGLEQAANFEGKWNPYVAEPINETANALELSEKEATNQLIRAKEKLFTARETRIRPGRDEKTLTSWNALMIKGMAIAGRQLQRPDLVESAGRAYDFVQSTLWQDNRLLATCKDGKAHLGAYLDDYAFLIDASLELLQTRWRTSDLLWTCDLADIMIDIFEDKDHGGFFFTSTEHEKLIHNPKPLFDEALPAGNAIAAISLARLGHLIGEQRYCDSAQQTLAAAQSSLQRVPHAHASLLMALQESLYPPKMVVIRGAEMDEWQQAIIKDYTHDRICFAIPDNATDLPGILADREITNQTVAYVCTEFSCLPAMTSLDSLMEVLNS